MEDPSLAKLVGLELFAQLVTFVRNHDGRSQPGADLEGQPISDRSTNVGTVPGRPVLRINVTVGITVLLSVGLGLGLLSGALGGLMAVKMMQ